MNCFFMVWVRRLGDFKTRWCLEVGDVGTKLRPKESTSFSIGGQLMGREISYGFIFEARLEFLEDRTLGASEVSRCACFGEEFLE